MSIIPIPSSDVVTSAVTRGSVFLPVEHPTRHRAGDDLLIHVPNEPSEWARVAQVAPRGLWLADRIKASVIPAWSPLINATVYKIPLERRPHVRQPPTERDLAIAGRLDRLMADPTGDEG